MTAIHRIWLPLLAAAVLPAHMAFSAEVRVPPGHGGLSLPCETCHTTQSWRKLRLSIQYDHAQTGFQLEGRHHGLPCVECHGKGEFANVQRSCRSCHKDIHRGENGLDCDRCHDVRSWVLSDPTGLHTTTRFPLTGVHAALDCESCHITALRGKYTQVAADCFSCHSRDYAGTVAPDHASAGFGHDCERCHTTASLGWQFSTFDHAQTAFALSGAHVPLTCAECHAGGVFSGVPTDCYGCHRPDYEATANPNHAATSLDTDCRTCHTNVAWSPASFDHAQTAFALSGAHVPLACAECHAGGVFSGIPTDCFGCHQADYERTDDPGHVLGRFSLTCLDCHTDAAWSPASFDHGQTQFPLTGGHVSVACVACHPDGTYRDTPADCYACHRVDFERARDPDHAVARFPIDCLPCHDTSRWEPSSFDHSTFFPIYIGEHRGEWDTCADCHTQPADYKLYSCVDCHEHRRTEMDSEHREVRDYVFNSQECFRCHPSGDESESEGGDD